MIYLVNDNGNIRVFHSEEAMKAAGFKKAGLSVSEEIFNSNGCYARLVDGKIVVEKTDAEKAEEEKQAQINERLGTLERIDRDSGASREVRDVSISAGVVLDAFRVLTAVFAEKLGIKLPKDFGKDVKSAADIMALAPAANATETEKTEFAMHKALLLVSHYDPAINPGLTKIREAEERAIPLRAELALLAGQ